MELRAAFDRRRRQAEYLEQQRNLDRLFGSLPEAFRDFTLESLAACSPEHSSLAEKICVWLDSDSWLYLHGPIGRGKTGAAVGAIRALAERHQTALYQDTTELLGELRPPGGDDDLDSRDARWRQLHSVQVLLLDELGTAKLTDWVAVQLWKLISYRHAHDKRTILTSNLSLPELVDYLGHARIPSRIRERAHPYVMDLLAPAEPPRDMRRCQWARF